MDELRQGFRAAAEVGIGAEERRIRGAVERGLFGSASAVTKIGRYTIEREIGSGASGRVYEGTDPALDRRVAIKTFKNAFDSPEATALIRSEAQAIARVQHPNVVTVFDVGLEGDDLFIAMELVEGIDLREWLAGRKRPREAVLQVMRAAGRGLAAVHAGGLVHRDFKPANVLLDADGRVRLADFGLATVVDVLEEAAASSSAMEVTDGASEPDCTLSRTRTIVGTPGYMAPEQHEGRSVDAAADQFAFCVTLFEALAGRRPFVATSLEDLALRKRGPIDWPDSTIIEPWLAVVLGRGLHADPEARFASMEALVDALQPPSSGRSRWLIGGAVTLAATIAVVSSLAGDGPCERFAEQAERAWQPATAEEVAAAIESTNVPHAESTNARVREGLDARFAALRTLHREVCAVAHATEDPPPSSAAALDCLAIQYRDLASVVAVLEQADVRIADRAAPLVAELPHADACRPERVDDAPRPSEDEAAEVAALRAELAAARALTRAAHYDEARDKLEALESAAVELEFEPVRLEVELVSASLASAVHEHAAAHQAYEDIAVRAAAAGADELAATAMLRVAQACTQPDERLDLERARWWARHAQALVDALDDPELEAELLTVRGAIGVEGGSPDVAQRHLEAAVEIFSVHRPDSLRLADAHQLLAIALALQQKHRDAQQHFELSVAAREALLGPVHPRVGDGLLNLANHLAVNGQTERGIAAAERALTIAESNSLTDDETMRLYLEAMGVNLVYADRGEEAREYFDRALVLAERSLGPDHPVVLALVANLGILAIGTGDHEEAIHRLERAVEGLTQHAPDDANRLRVALINLGRAYREAGRYDAAESALQRALVISSGAAAADVWSALGQLASVRGRYELAVQHYAHEVEVSDAHDTDTLRAAARWRLAGALIQTGELERAKDLGCWAVAHLEDQVEGIYAGARTEAEGWLAEEGVDCEARPLTP